MAEMLHYEGLYQSKLSQVEMVNTEWQKMGETNVALKSGMTQQVDLVFADPFYASKYQPSKSEHGNCSIKYSKITQYLLYLVELNNCPRIGGPYSKATFPTVP